MARPQNLYDLLGVAKDADKATIRKRYRALARELHPDLNSNDPVAEARFKQVAHAFSVLNHDDKRALYDEFGDAALESGFDPEAARRARAAFASGPEAAAGFEFAFGDDRAGMRDFGDVGGLFGSLFGHEFRREPSRGADLEALVELDFVEAALGVERSLELVRDRSGRGGSPHRVKVRFRPGVADGDRLRIRGRGLPGAHGAPAGDLWVRVRVRPHRVFERCGDDLHIEVPISVRESILGTSIDVPTLEGRATVQVPPGMDSGKSLRLRGKGIARPDGTRGDLLARVQICAPKRLDGETREAIAKLERFEDPDLRKRLFS